MREKSKREEEQQSQTETEANSESLLYFGIFLTYRIKTFLMTFKKSQMIKFIHSGKCLEVLSISTAQNSPSQASTVCKPRTSRCSSWIQKRQRNQRSNGQHLLGHRKSKKIPEKNIYFCFIDYAKAFVWIKLENSSRDENIKSPYLPPEIPVCKSRSNSQNQTWNNGLVQNWERSISRSILSPCFFCNDGFNNLLWT